MDQVLSNAFSILIVGMVTVFLMLWVVVLIGNLLIWGTNKFETEELTVQKKENPIPNSKGSIAAIVAAVEFITKGKGRVSNITKL